MVWLFFIFHLDLGHSAKTKVRPPKNKNKKKGVLATWAPHRPNPLGLSLARVDKVMDGSLLISGIDLVDQTPIVDIKPYHCQDYLSLEEMGLPFWIEEAKDERLDI